MKLTVLDEVASTNEVVKNALREGKAEGLIVRARRQSSGYGRQGREWDSPEGGLYMSILLRPDVAGSGLATLSLVVGLSVQRALGQVAAPQFEDGIQVKWPNDVIYMPADCERADEYRKLCGISLEACGGGVCVGIGINVCQRRGDFLPELRETAASLSMIAGAEMDRTALETAFLEELESLRQELPQETAERRQEYSAACLNLGRRVRVLRPDGERSALAVSLTPDYGLAVRYDDGTEEVLRSGEVSVRGLYGYTDKE